MHWRKHNLWEMGIILAGMLLPLILLWWTPVSAAETHQGALDLATTATVTAQTTPTVDATVTALSKEQLVHENDWWWNYGATILTSLISTFTLAAAGIFTVVRYFNDRKAEREKRAEERFQSVVEGLGSERMEAKVGAAITLRTFLQPGYERFYGQAFDLAVAHLRLRKAEASIPETPSAPTHVLIISRGNLRQEQQPPSPTASIPLDSLSQALIIVFKESFLLAREEMKKIKESSPLVREEMKKMNAQFNPQRLDATNIRLDHAYLVGADLVHAWLEGASLREANLYLAQLKGTYLVEANLEGADLAGAQLERGVLYDAQLKEADLAEAQLKGVALMRANLGKANLGKANLEGADLRKTNLGGTWLRGANLRDADLWRADLSNANLDGANLGGANLRDADLSGVHDLEEVLSLKGCDLRGVKGLTKEQLKACQAKGAIIGEDLTISSSQSTVAPPSQSPDTQASSAPLLQESLLPPDTGASSAAAPKQGSGS